MGNGEVGFSKLSGGMQTFFVFLAIIGAVVPCVLGFVNFDKRLDVQETKTTDHINKDEVRWYDIDEDIDDIRKSVIDVEKDQIKRAAEYAALRDDNARQERTLTLVLQELKRLELNNNDDK